MKEIMDIVFTGVASLAMVGIAYMAYRLAQWIKNGGM